MYRLYAVNCLMTLMLW